MNVSDAKKAVAASYLSHRPVFLWGAPGVGKSDAVRQAAATLAKHLKLSPDLATLGTALSPAAAKKSFGLYDVRLSQCDAVDLRGLPMVTSASTKKSSAATSPASHVTTWAAPDWLPHTGRDDVPSQGILFLDEMNSAPLSVQAAAYQLVLDRRMGAYTLKEGWGVVMAGNRMGDGGVTYKMPRPLANRMIHIDVETDVDTWSAWAVSTDIPQELVAFLRLRPDLLSTFEEHVKKRMDGEAFATPRSWAMVADLLPVAMPDHILSALTAGCVGAGPAAEFLAYRQVWRDMPDIDAILADPAQAPVPEDAGTLFAVATALADRMTNPDHLGPVLTYIDRLPPEFAVLVAKDATRRSQDIIKSELFGDWTRRNADLF